MALVILASMFIASVKAEEAAAPAPAVEAAAEAKTGMVAAVLAQVMKPVNWTQENFWNKYPHIAGGTATFVALWAACRMYKPLGKVIFGCESTKRNQERAEYSF